MISNVTAVDSSLIIRWYKLTYNGGYPVDDANYFVQYSTNEQHSNDSHCQLCLLTNSIKDINITLKGLARLTKYWIRVLAENPVGRSYGRWYLTRTLGNASALSEEYYT